MSRRHLFRIALLVSVVSASRGAAIAADQEFWGTYNFIAPYAGRRLGVAVNSSDTWKGGVRLGRVGWLAGWEADISVEPAGKGTGHRHGASLDGFLKPVESARAALLILAGLGATRVRGGQEPGTGVFLHYRYGLAYRLRFGEGLGLRLDLTALRSPGGGFSSREANLGWIAYF